MLPECIIVIINNNSKMQLFIQTNYNVTMFTYFQGNISLFVSPLIYPYCSLKESKYYFFKQKSSFFKNLAT